MKKYLKHLTFLLFLTLTVSCSKDDAVEQEQPSENVELNNEINDFVWKAMNNWYFWQSSVANLADTKDNDQDAYYTYLNGYSSPETLFNSLIFNADDFSWYIEDIDAQLNAFRGITESYGIKLGYVIDYQGNTVIYVTYTVEGSPADNAGIKRGDLIYKVDGTVLTSGNYQILNRLFTETSISLGIATIENGMFTPGAEDIALTAVQLTENPVAYSAVIEEGGKKIGYFVYNGFRSTFHSEMNAVFGDFKSAGIDELILDLRYNGGGSVLTSTLLASMIDGSRPAFQEVFADLRYNEKRNDENGFLFPFVDEVYLYDKTTGSYLDGQDEAMNRLSGLSRLVVLTTNRTASASEMVINGLRPNMDVVLIGDVTTGKNEGSNTLVDAPKTDPEEAYLDLNSRNPNHTVGLQPITFQVFNSQGNSDYANGFNPDFDVREYLSVDQIKPFGNTDDLQLRAALDYISGGSAKAAAAKAGFTSQKVGNPPTVKFEQEMFILPGEMDPLKNQ